MNPTSKKPDPTDARQAGPDRVGLPEALLRATTAPLLGRVKLGEGMLIPINVSLAWGAGHDLKRGILEALLSVLALATMYEVNDLLDAERDLDNPRKDRALARALLTHRALLLRVLAVQHLIAVLGATFLLGPLSGAMMASVLAINVGYSLYLKGVPFLDVVVVGLWGGTFAAIVVPSSPALAVGAMTAVSHVFQALGDRSPDLRAGLRTSAASPRVTHAALGTASLALVLALHPLVPSPWAWMGLVPLLIGVFVRHATLAWRLSKVAFAVVWLVVVDGLARGR